MITNNCFFHTLLWVRLDAKKLALLHLESEWKVRTRLSELLRVAQVEPEIIRQSAVDFSVEQAIEQRTRRAYCAIIRSTSRAYCAIIRPTSRAKCARAEPLEAGRGLLPRTRRSAWAARLDSLHGLFGFPVSEA